MQLSRILVDQLRQSVVVTGGASGFGESTVRWMHQRGANVVIADINKEKGERLASTLSQQTGGKVVFIRTDVTDRASWATLVNGTMDKLGSLDVLVNNAGGSYVNKPALDVSEDEFEKCIDLNVRSLFYSVGAVMPHFVQQKSGVVVNVSSTAAIRPRGGLTWYNASKSAVSGATKSLAIEFASSGIRVNAVCPVAGRTPLLKTFLGNNSEASFIKTVPMGRLSEPEDVASAIGFLASDEARFITGVCLEVDGGRCI